MTEPNATVTCGVCSARTRRLLQPGTRLLHFTCPRCRKSVPYTVSYDVRVGVVRRTRTQRVLGSGRVDPPLSVLGAGSRVVWLLGSQLRMPYCCDQPNYTYEAGVDAVKCRVCDLAWTMDSLVNGLARPTDEPQPSRRQEKRKAAAHREAMARGADAGAQDRLLGAEIDRTLKLIEEIRNTANDEVMPHMRGAVVGYRAWAFDASHGWYLSGTGYRRGDAWNPERMVDGVFEAECEAGRGHPAPDPDCDCGFYGLARFTNRSAWWSAAASQTICGAIRAWADADENGMDRFIVQPPGFRSQYAQIVLLAIDPEWPPLKQQIVRSVAKDYGADVCKWEHLDAAAAEHGQLVPDDVLEWALDDGVWTGQSRVDPSPELMSLIERAVTLRAQVDDVLAAWHRGDLSATVARKLLSWDDPPDHPNCRHNFMPPPTGGSE